MKNSQDQQNTTLDIKPNFHDSQTEEPTNNATKTPIPDSGSVSLSSTSDNRKVSREDIELVQNLIERCLQLYMNKDEVVKTLLNRARIDPGFTTLEEAKGGMFRITLDELIHRTDFDKLEEENAEFYRAYYIRLKLKKQIILFNHLLEHQYHLMKYPAPPKIPLPPMQNGIHPMPVNNLPMGYPVIQHHPPLAATGQPHMDHHMGHSMPCHIVNGVPAPGNFHPMRMNSGNEMTIGSTTADISPIMPPNNAMSSDIPVSPTSVASSGHFPFSASDISGLGVDTSALDSAFTSDVASSVGLQLPPDNGAGNSRDPLRSLDQIPWNFSLLDLTADLSNLGDLGALGNYPSSPFLPSDSDILLDSPEQEDIVEEFFVDSDSIPGQCPPADEEKS